MHTPGPWVVQELDAKSKSDLHIDSPVAFWIAQESFAGEVTAVVEDVSRERGLANARLVASAPDLLAALYQVEDSVRNALNGEPDIDIDAVRAAIAKAEGR